MAVSSSGGFDQHAPAGLVHNPELVAAPPLQALVAVLGSVSCITRNIDYFVKRPSRAGIYSSLKVTVLSPVETTAAERYSYTGENTLLSGYCF